MNTPSPVTLRAAIAGFVLAILLCAVNSYLTLSFGVIEEGPTIAALLFFAVFYVSSVKITTTEMVVVATMGSAGGSLGFISNFYAARAMVGAPMGLWEAASFAVVTSLLGLFFTVPLRDLLILREDLPWPGSKATSSIIQALVDAGDPKQAAWLFGTIAVLMAVVIGNDDGGYGWLPAESALPLVGAFGAAVAWSPFAIGGAFLMGMRTCVGFLVAALVLMVMAPYTPTPEAPNRYVWPGIGFLVATGLTQLALNGKIVAASLRSLGKLGQGGDDDDPPMSGAVWLGLGAVSLVATLGWGFAAGLNLIVLGLLVAVGGLLQNIIATRAAAQTAFNPARVMGVLLQGVTAAAGGSAAATNLIGAGFVAGSGAQAGNLTGDLAYGRWLGVPSRWQFWLQATTVVPCALVSAWVFTQIAGDVPTTPDGEGLPSPVARMWAASAQVFDGTVPMPPGAVQAMIVGAVVGAVYVLLESMPAVEAWLPASVGVGIGMVLPVSVDLAFFLGGVLFYVVLGRGLKVSELTLTTVAVGSIIAEGFGGIAKPVLVMLGLLS
jgi:uncharacterized oligopeptide transporter (OPT) family protein